MDMDNAHGAVVAAKTQLEQLEQQQEGIRNQLLGDPNLPIEKYPPYAQASAALDQAKRDLDHTVLRAPIGGMATQVASIQMGRYVTAGTPVFSLIDDAKPWVDANPKETDITHLRIGQPVTISVDTFPGRPFRGTVAAVSPGTGAQFAILPPQNASGNWVKVVQRVPVRIEFAAERGRARPARRNERHGRHRHRPAEHGARRARPHQQGRGTAPMMAAAARLPAGARRSAARPSAP